MASIASYETLIQPRINYHLFNFFFFFLVTEGAAAKRGEDPGAKNKNHKCVSRDTFFLWLRPSSHPSHAFPD